jgi:hypothetical protein
VQPSSDWVRWRGQQRRHGFCPVDADDPVELLVRRRTGGRTLSAASREVHRHRLADGRDGGRRRRHERFVRLRGAKHLRSRADLRLDRANLGGSDPAAGPRELSDLVADSEALLKTAKIPGPYVLVGTSGGGYISAGFAYEHPDEVAGMVFVDVAAQFRNPPREIVQETDPHNPSNIERRDYLQVEKDAWAGRKRIGDIPVTIISNEYSAAEIHGSPFPSEAAGMSSNVSDQKGWLVLSPRAKQMVVHTGHAVEEQDPQFVIDAIVDVARAAR